MSTYDGYPAQGGAVGGGLTFARVVKKVDQTVNNSIILVDDDELKFTPSINKKYGWILTVFRDASTIADMKTTVTIPTGATADTQHGDVQTNVVNGLDATAVLLLAGGGLGNSGGSTRQGKLIMGGTAGDFTVQFAQDVAEVSDAKFLAGSFLIVWEEA